MSEEKTPEPGPSAKPDPRHAAHPAGRRFRAVPQDGHPAAGHAARLDPAHRRGHVPRPHDRHGVRPTRARPRRAAAPGELRRHGHERPDSQARQEPGEPHAAARPGPGPLPRESAHAGRGQALLAGERRALHGRPGARPRDRGADGQPRQPLRAGRTGLADAAGGGRVHGAVDQGARGPGRHGRLLAQRDRRGKAEGARDALGVRPAQGGHPHHQQADRNPRARQEDPGPGQGGHGQKAARVLPARAAQGHPDGARREGRERRGGRGATGPRSRSRAARRGAARRPSASSTGWRACTRPRPSTRSRAPTWTG